MRQILSCRTPVAALGLCLVVISVLPTFAVAAPGVGVVARARVAPRAAPRPVASHSSRQLGHYGSARGYSGFGRSVFARQFGRDRFDRYGLFGPIAPGYFGYDGYGEAVSSRTFDEAPLELSPATGLPVVIGIASPTMARPQVIVINSDNKRGEPRASLHGPGGPGAARDRAAFMAPRVIRVDVPPG